MKGFVILVSFLLHILQTEGQTLNIEDPVRVPVKVLRRGANSTCPSEQDVIDAKDELRHQIASTTLSAVAAGCGGAGWRRIGYLDMTDPSQSCPPGLILESITSQVRACGRASLVADCWSTYYNNSNSQYSRVCGRVRGYQFGSTRGFFRGSGQEEVDDVYVNGVSLTHGQSGNRTHIWTFAAGYTEIDSSREAFAKCPCLNAGATPPPLFVGSDYFCESGRPNDLIFFTDDALWDGQNCTTGNCCAFNNPPYFTKTLPTPTSDDIELRICNQDGPSGADSPIDQVELYVQ